MLAIRLPKTIERRLEKLAKRSGRTKSFYAREAILRYLEDLEDVHLAEVVWRRIRSGEESTISLEESLKSSVRFLSESLRLAKARRSSATVDPDFARDVEAAVKSHPEPLKPPAWD